MSKVPEVPEEVGPPRSRWADVKVLLICLAILFLLLALTFGGFNYVKAKQAREQAALQVSLLKNALVVYKAATGGVPVHAVTDGRAGTEKIHAALHPAPGGGRVFLPDLDPARDPQGWLAGATGPGPHKIYDPWGREFHYRSNRPGRSAVFAKNPDFDLWSAGPDGLTTASSGGVYDPTAPENRDDIGF
ncbi:hypothetical protein [Haloferula sp. A504]|uniref:hypothetical protein n=1 Tax=Haloferula sp. A504 TaxID=3373601 RepID=UPI0031CBFFA9|nr:type II secretion system protein GspG [Verrucomicrobiaceae bacterium E54]